VIVFVIALVVFGIGTVKHLRLKWKVTSLRRQLEERGEKFSIARLAPPILSQSNTSDSLIRAANSLQLAPWRLPHVMAIVAPGHARVSWQRNQLPARDAVDIWPELVSEVAASAEALEQIRQAADSVISFPLDYSQSYALRLPHLAPLKGSVVWLNAAMITDLRRNQLASAVSNLCAAVSTVRNYRVEPVLLSHLVHIAMASICVDMTWEALQHPGWSDSDLARLQVVWQQVDVTTGFDSALAMQRLWILDAIADFRRDPHGPKDLLVSSHPPSAGSELWDLVKQVFENPKEGLYEIACRYPGYYAWRWWRSYGDEAAVINTIQRIVDVSREYRLGGVRGAVFHTELGESGELMDSDPLEWSRLKYATNGLQRDLRKYVVTAQKREMMLAAIALKRYSLAHGRLPDRLDDLVPRFLQSVPTDLFGGTPLHYRRRSEDTFLVYSVGLDGVDQGGDPKPTEEKEGSDYNTLWYLAVDMVWPAPGTPDEILAFEKRTAAEPLLRNPPSGVSTPELKALAERYGLSFPLTNGPSSGRR
jgi:hypothetical protein